MIHREILIRKEVDGKKVEEIHKKFNSDEEYTEFLRQNNMSLEISGIQNALNSMKRLSNNFGLNSGGFDRFRGANSIDDPAIGLFNYFENFYNTLANPILKIGTGSTKISEEKLAELPSSLKDIHSDVNKELDEKVSKMQSEMNIVDDYLRRRSDSDISEDHFKKLAETIIAETPDRESLDKYIKNVYELLRDPRYRNSSKLESALHIAKIRDSKLSEIESITGFIG